MKTIKVYTELVRSQTTATVVGIKRDRAASGSPLYLSHCLTVSHDINSHNYLANFQFSHFSAVKQILVGNQIVKMILLLVRESKDQFFLFTLHDLFYACFVKVCVRSLHIRWVFTTLGRRKSSKWPSFKMTAIIMI